MAAEAENGCTCGHPQSKHKSLKLGCRGCDLGCARFEPEETAEPVVKPIPAEELVPVDEEAAETPDCCEGEPAFGDPNGLHTFDCPVYQKNLAAMIEQNTSAQPVRAADLDLARPNPGAPERLREVERERDDLRADAESARHLLGRIEKAAGAEDTDPFTDLAEFVRGLRVQLGEALERSSHFEGRAVDQLAATVKAQAELTAARETIVALMTRVESLGAELEHAEQYARDLQDNGDVPTTTDRLLGQADATAVPAIVHTSDSIRELIGQLREQLAEHDRLEGLRSELGQLEERAAEIRQQIADAEKPPAPLVADKTIRDWARKNGFECDPRGRVPVWLRTQYLHANPTTANTRSTS